MLKFCPYWPHDGSEECLMTRGGLYIPMPEHIKMYCKTQSYGNCYHYLKECEQLVAPVEKRAMALSGRDRRRFQRVAGRYSLILASCDGPDRPQEMMTDKACTLDLSLGGMRFESPADLPVRRMIAFTFGADFVAPSLTGIGEVMWCEEDSAAEHYVAGLSFSFVDNQMRLAIGSQVGGIQM